MESIFLRITEAAPMAAGLRYFEFGAERLPDIARGHSPRERLIGCRTQCGEPIVAQQNPRMGLPELLGYRSAERAMPHRPLAGNKLGTVTGNEIDRYRVGNPARHRKREPLNDR